MSGALKRDEWETVRLGDVCEVNPSKKFNVTISDDLNVGFLPMEAVSNEGDILRIDTRKYGEVKKGFSGFQDGDVLIAKITPCMENGKGALVSGMPCGIGFGSTEFHVLRPNLSKCHAKYIFHILENPLLRQDFARKMTGSAGQKRLPKDALQKLEILLPPLDIQRRIAETLDKVTELITLRKTQLEKLDELVKARFVELFDVQKCRRKTLGECTDFVDYRGHTPELSDTGTIRMVNAKSVGKGFFKYVDEYVTEETYDSWMHRGFGYPGDILFVTEGHTFGNTCLIPNDLKKFALGQRVITIKGHEEVLNAFLCSYMQTDLFWKDINVYRTGGTAQGIRSKDLVKVYVPIPPLEQQKQFASFVEQTDKSKVIIQQSLDALETLKKSLMQEYFG